MGSLSIPIGGCRRDIKDVGLRPWLPWERGYRSWKEGKGMLSPPNTLLHPWRGRSHLSGSPLQTNSARREGSPTLGVHFSTPPFPLPPLGLGRRDAPPGAGTSDPGSITPPAASPPAPSRCSTGRGINERRAEKKQHGASPSHCCSPRHPPSPPNREKPTSPRAPPARGWECGSNCTWQGSNSESKTVVWLVSHPGPAALLFSFACLNPFQPRPLSPAGPPSPQPRCGEGWGAKEKPHPKASSHHPATLLLEMG